MTLGVVECLKMRLIGRLIQNNLFGRLRSLTLVGILILVLLTAEKRLRAKESHDHDEFGNGNLFCPSRSGLEYLVLIYKKNVNYFSVYIFDFEV